MRPRHGWHRPSTAAAVVVAGLLLVACGDGAGSSAPDVPATGDEASVDSVDGGTATTYPEVTLTVQGLHGPDTAAGRAFSAWADAVEEASGGNVTFDLIFAAALVEPADVEAALTSGLLDIALHATLYSPAQFPIDGLVQDLSTVGVQAPITGTLQGLGAHVEAGFDPFYVDSMRQEGLQPLVPFVGSVISSYQLLCAGEPVRSLDEAQGRRVRVAGETYAAEAEALGMTPVSMSVTEVYEGMQRGVVDCNIQGATDLHDSGLLEVADHWTSDPEVSFSGLTSVHTSVSAATWDDLPVEVQRLLWDTAYDVWLREFTGAVLTGSAAAVEHGEEQGVDFHVWESDARDALRAHQEATVEAARSEFADLGPDAEAFAEGLVDLHATWLDVVADLGYREPERSTVVDLARDDAATDVGPFVERLTERLADARP